MSSEFKGSRINPCFPQITRFLVSWFSFTLCQNDECILNLSFRLVLFYCPEDQNKGLNQVSEKDLEVRCRVSRGDIPSVVPYLSVGFVTFNGF